MENQVGVWKGVQFDDQAVKDRVLDAFAVAVFLAFSCGASIGAGVVLVTLKIMG